MSYDGHKKSNDPLKDMVQIAPEKISDADAIEIKRIFSLEIIQRRFNQSFNIYNIIVLC